MRLLLREWDECYTCYMQNKALTFLLYLPLTAAALGEATIELEVATERGLQITAPHEWLQLLAKVGVSNVRIRLAGSGEAARIETRGASARPRYQVTGILTAREKLHLPGAVFARNDRAKLADYFNRLKADGPEAVTAPTGNFGLNERQFVALHEDLAHPFGVATKGRTLKAIVDELTAKLNYEVVFSEALGNREPIDANVERLSTGTGLAIVLRSHGLALRPDKPRGKHVRLVIEPLSKRDTWPVGWTPEGRTRTIAPSLFEFLNAEISGFSLQETLDAITPRLSLPVIIDGWTLDEHDIDLSKIQVTYPKKRTYYKRILDSVLSRAHLHGKLRIDEQGTPFYWVTR